MIQLDIGDKIFFAGKQNEMQKYYAVSDLLVYPSLYEPFANVCLEACACGLPVLTTSQNGSCELIEHGKNGYIIENANKVTEMSELISNYYKLSNSEKIDMSQKAYETIDGYEWSAHVDDLELIFKDITKRSAYEN